MCICICIYVYKYTYVLPHHHLCYAFATGMASGCQSASNQCGPQALNKGEDILIRDIRYRAER